MKNGKCIKQFPKLFINNTQTGNDGHPKYRRRSPKSGGETFERQISNDHKVTDN